MREEAVNPALMQAVVHKTKRDLSFAALEAIQNIPTRTGASGETTYYRDAWDATADAIRQERRARRAEEAAQSAADAKARERLVSGYAETSG